MSPQQILLRPAFSMSCTHLSSTLLSSFQVLLSLLRYKCVRVIFEPPLGHNKAFILTLKIQKTLY